MSRILLVITWSILMQLKGTAQSKWVFENYHYLDQPGENTLVPVLHFETPGKLYGELRYNYEAGQTITLLGGRTFRVGKTTPLIVTPMAGLSAGRFTGITAGVRGNIEPGRFYFSTETQQSWGTNKKSDSFFFSWSEAGYTISDHFFAGIALQYSGGKWKNQAEPGMIAGFSVKDFSFPCYLFKSPGQDYHVVLGMNYEWRFRKRASS